MGLRTKNVTLKATEAEHAAWSAAAKADGRTLSQWIARRCNGERTTNPVFATAAPDTAAPDTAAPRPVRRTRRKV